MFDEASKIAFETEVTAMQTAALQPGSCSVLVNAVGKEARSDTKPKQN